MERFPVLTALHIILMIRHLKLVKFRFKRNIKCNKIVKVDLIYKAEISG